MPVNTENTNVSDWMKIQMIKLHHQGVSQEGIGELTKRNLTTVKKILRDYLRPDRL